MSAHAVFTAEPKPLLDAVAQIKREIQSLSKLATSLKFGAPTRGASPLVNDAKAAQAAARATQAQAQAAAAQSKAAQAAARAATAQINQQAAASRAAAQSQRAAAQSTRDAARAAAEDLRKQKQLGASWAREIEAEWRRSGQTMNRFGEMTKTVTGYLKGIERSVSVQFRVDPRGDLKQLRDDIRAAQKAAGALDVHLSTQQAEKELDDLIASFKNLKRQANLSLSLDDSGNIKRANLSRNDDSQRHNARDQLGDRVSMAATGGGLAIAGALGLATRESIKFEESFSGVRKTVDATDAQLADIEKKLRAMAAGKNPIPIDVNELNRIAEAGGQLGIATGSLVDFTRVMAQMGATTNLTSDQAASDMAGLANVTQMSQSKFENLGSTIVELGNKYNATEQEITAMALRLSGAGHQIGLTPSQITSVATALANVKIEAEAGGSAFSRVFVAMDKSARQGGDSLKVFAAVAGMSASEFKKLYSENTASALAAFVEGLGKVKKAGGDTFGVLDKLGLSEIRVRDALLRTSSAQHSLSEVLQTGEAAWQKNTALQDEFGKKAATNASKIQIAQNRVRDLAISVGNELVPALEPLLRLADDLLKAWNRLPRSTQANIVKFAAYASILLIVGGRIKGLIDTLALLRIAMAANGATAGGAATQVGLLSRAVRLLATLAKNPITIGIVLGGAGYEFLRKLFPEFGANQESIGEMASHPGEVFSRLGGRLGQYFLQDDALAYDNNVRGDAAWRETQNINARRAHQQKQRKLAAWRRAEAKRMAAFDAKHRDPNGDPGARKPSASPDLSSIDFSSNEQKKAVRDAERALRKQQREEERALRQQQRDAARERQAELKMESDALGDAAQAWDKYGQTVQQVADKQIEKLAATRDSVIGFLQSVEDKLVGIGAPMGRFYDMVASLKGVMGDAQLLGGLYDASRRASGRAAEYSRDLRSRSETINGKDGIIPQSANYSNGSGGSDTIAVASQYLGKSGGQLGARVLGNAYGLEWCVGFVRAVQSERGIKTWYRGLDVSGFRNWARRTGRAYNGTPQVGDAYTIKGKSVSHTGFVSGVNGNRFTTIGGNEGAKDNYQSRVKNNNSYRIDDPRITFIRTGNSIRNVTAAYAPASRASTRGSGIETAAQQKKWNALMSRAEFSQTGQPLNAAAREANALMDSIYGRPKAASTQRAVTAGSSPRAGSPTAVQLPSGNYDALLQNMERPEFNVAYTKYSKAGIAGVYAQHRRATQENEMRRQALLLSTQLTPSLHAYAKAKGLTGKAEDDYVKKVQAALYAVGNYADYQGTLTRKTDETSDALKNEIRELEDAARRIGRDNPLARLNDRAGRGEFKNQNAEQVRRLYTLTRISMMADAANPVKESVETAKKRTEYLQREIQLIREGLTDETQRSQIVEEEMARRERINALRKAGWTLAIATRIAEDEALAKWKANTLERDKARAQEQMQALDEAKKARSEAYGSAYDTLTTALGEARTTADELLRVLDGIGQEAAAIPRIAALMSETKLRAQLLAAQERSAALSGEARGTALSTRDDNKNRLRDILESQLTEVERLQRRKTEALDKFEAQQMALGTDADSDKWRQDLRDLAANWDAAIQAARDYETASRKAFARDFFKDRHRQMQLAMEPNEIKRARLELQYQLEDAGFTDPIQIKAILDAGQAYDEAMRLRSNMQSAADSLAGSFTDIFDEGLGGALGKGLSHITSWLANVSKQIIANWLVTKLFGFLGLGNFFGQMQGAANMGVQLPGMASTPPIFAATGMERVPHDGFRAVLHKDEAVLNATDAQMWRGIQSKMFGGTSTSTQNTKNTTVYNIENLHTNDAQSFTRDVQRAGVTPSKSQTKQAAGAFFDGY